VPSWRKKLLKFLNIFEYFTQLFEYFQTFSNVFEYFQTFSNVFERFFLTYFTQTLQFNKATPVFTPKTNVALKNNPKNPVFH